MFNDTNVTALENAQSRSFVDLNILNCASGSKAEMEADLDEMKDLRSFTGVSTAYRVMAVSPHAKYLLFKKNNKQLFLHDIDDEMQCCEYIITGIDLTHDEDTVFDIAFLDERTVCVILQNRDGKLYITKGELNFSLKLVIICSAITFTQIICRKHYTTSVIYDETGPVLISYPLSFQNKNDTDPPKIWLLHLSNFYARKGVRTVVIEPAVKDKKALFCDPFIYRNRVYLFNRFESTILCVAITGRNRGVAHVLSTSPDVRFQRPNNRYANRCLFLLGNIILAYCHQRLDKPDQEPQLWLLELKTLTWHRLQLILNHHYPVGLVSFQKASDEQLAFLHGECGRSGCLEKVHLYQLSTAQECVTPCERKSLIDRKSSNSCEPSKRSASTVEMHRSSSSINNKNSNASTSSTTAEVTVARSETTTAGGAVASRIAPSLRYIRKCNRDKTKKNSSPSTTTTTTSTIISQLGQSSNQQQPSSSTSSLSPPPALSSSETSANSFQNGSQYVHWSEEMAEEGGALTISEQLRLAKDMGYSDEEIMQAISMNCAKDGSYRAFSSTNAMIDMLARVQRMYETSGDALGSGSGSGPGNGFGSGRKYDSGIHLGNSSSDADLDRRLSSCCFRFASCNRSSQALPPYDSYARCSPPHTPSGGSGIRRAISFHSASAPDRKSPDAMTSSFHEYRSGPTQFQLQRLLDAFEKEQKSFNDESTRSIRALEERCRQFADNQSILQVRLLEKDSEIELLKAQLSTRAALDEQLRLTKTKLDTELLENRSKADQIRVLTEQAEVVKRQHESEIREKDKLISELFSKLHAAEDANKPALEKIMKLQCEIDELKKQLAKKEADLEKCGNCYDEMRKAEQLIEQIRLERDEVRSTLNKIPTCVICLDKRPQMLYMPCSHFICCEACGSRFEHCPACRQKICGKITVYQ